MLLALTLMVALCACGGGGGGGAAATATTGAPPPAPTAPSAPTPPSAPSAPTTPATPSSPSPDSGDSGMARALGASASFAVDGIPSAPTLAGTDGSATGRVFHVDSGLGDDAGDGLAATTGSGHGPWRTLARLLSAGIGPGDTVQLACGSLWNETLRLPASGSATAPIAVRSAPGCSTPPTIDGSVVLANSSWQLHSGNVFKSTLDRTPLQLSSAPDGAATSLTAAQWPQAYHPNRGHLPAAPDSPYLATAAASDATTTGQPVSTYLVSGSDLALPAGASLVGAGVRIRTYAWWMDESVIAGVSGNRLQLGVPTAYPVEAGWGYYFTGKLWMVDSPGEWHYDAATRQLYAYMAGASLPASPVRATVQAIGIDLQARNHITIDGLRVRRVGVGIDLRRTTGSVVRNSVFEDTVDQGADATESRNTLIESNSFTRTGLDAVSGWRHGLVPSNAMVVRNNLIRESGVLTDGDRILGLPRMSLAAILGGEASLISGNTVLNTGYIGILVRQGSTIEKNLVYGACSVLDDCGGIFAQYRNANAVIRGNTVLHSRGALAGKPAGAETQAQGIDLDESASGTLIEDNTVIDTDNGILLHVSSNNIVRNNRLYGNRRSQIWLQVTYSASDPTRELVDNVISGNQLAAVYPGSVGLWLDTVHSSTARFGVIEGNRYFDRASPVAVRLNTANGTRQYSFDQWQRSTATDLPTGRDSTGFATSGTGYTNYSPAGSSLVAPFTAASTAGWNTWNATAPMGRLVREACSAGFCLRHVAGGSVGVISSPNFSVVRGQWYRMSIDLATETEGQNVRLVVRRGGGGNNGYDSVIDRDILIVGSRTWGRYSVIFQATTTVNARDPVTLDEGARIDVEPVSAGATLSLASPEIVPITPNGTAAMSGTFINLSGAARSWACPFASSQPALCDKFRLLADDSVVSWPLSLAGRSAAILYAQEPAMLDSDGDGIADLQDQCPATPARRGVNALGCPLLIN